jgi:hypothetical protein
MVSKHSSAQQDENKDENKPGKWADWRKQSQQYFCTLLTYLQFSVIK